MVKELQEIKDWAEAAGTNLTALCRKANVARSTPARWLGESPKGAPNTRTLERLRAALREIVAERQKKLAAAGLIQQQAGLNQCQCRFRRRSGPKKSRYRTNS